MKHRITILKDILGSDYLGIKIPKEILEPYLSKLKQILGEQYDLYRKYQIERDDGEFHLTFANVPETKKFLYDIKYVNLVEKLYEYEVEFILTDLSVSTNGENTSYMVCVKSDDLANLRETFGLGEKVFHITIGFKTKDVHGKPITKVGEYNPFLKELSKKFHENDDFSFLQTLRDYEKDKKNPFEIPQPISISDSSATFRLGNEDYFSVAMINDELTINAKWQDKNKKPILPLTIIYKIIS